MAKTVEIKLSDLVFATRCCGCGSDDFVMSSRHESVKTKSVAGETKYKKVHFKLPLCERCTSWNILYLLGAGFAMLSDGLFLSMGDLDTEVMVAGLGVFLACMYLFFLKFPKKHYQVLDYDGKAGLLKIRFRNSDFANEMARIAKKNAETPTPDPVYPTGPVPEEDLQRIQQYANLAMKTLKDLVAEQAGYNVASITVLSSGVNSLRLKADAMQREKIANIYGAFLGCAIIENYKSHKACWVKTKDGIGIKLEKPGTKMPLIVFPFTRLFKHFDQGEEQSMLNFYVEIPIAIEALANFKPPTL